MPLDALADKFQPARYLQLALLPQHRREIGALDVWHRDVLHAFDVAEIVNADDVLVRDLAREQQLLLELPLDLRRRVRVDGGVGADQLQGDRDAELRVPGVVDRAHAADPEQPDDVITGAEYLTGDEHLRVTSAARRSRQGAGGSCDARDVRIQLVSAAARRRRRRGGARRFKRVEIGDRRRGGP